MRTGNIGIRAGLALFALLALVFAPIGCGGNGGSSDSGTDSGPPGEAYAYVTTRVVLPDGTGNTEKTGIDINGDGVVDNSLGSLLAFLPTIPGLDSFDANMSIQEALVDGSLVLLWNVANVNSFTTDPTVTVQVFLGAEACLPPPDEDMCTDLTMYTGGETFTIAADSPDIAPSEAGIGQVACLGMFGSGELRSCPGNLPLPIPLSEISPGVALELDVDLVSARIECDGISATNLTDCVLGGAITQEQIDNELIPTIVSVVMTLITEAAILDMAMAVVPCISDNTMIGDHVSADCMALGDPDAVCSASNGVDMGICVDGTEGVVEFALADNFDMNGNGILEADELDPILSLVLVPDLDLDDDGVNDAISIGLGFDAAEATIEGI